MRTGAINNSIEKFNSEKEMKQLQKKDVQLWKEGYLYG